MSGDVPLLKNFLQQGETEEVGKLFETTMMKKYGPAELKNHYLVMDTICDATQVCVSPALLLWQGFPM